MKTLLFILITTLSLYAKVEFEVLGSGGPELDGRASTSYLVWIDGKARLLVDMGSGSMLRYEQSGAKLDDLEAVVLTHMHIDHVVDLPSYVKAGYFTTRRAPLDIIGPSGDDAFPSTTEYLQTLFGKNGAYRYMSDVLTPQSDSFEIIPYDIKRKTVKHYKDFTLTLLHVHHGNVPALALRIDTKEGSIVISGDTNNRNHQLEKLLKGADLFVAHHAIAQSARGYATQLHMNPQIIAKTAQKMGVKKVLLTHRMLRTRGEEKETLQVIRKWYRGEVVFAEDRMKVVP